MGGTNPKIAVYATVAVMAALLLATLSACGAVQRFKGPKEGASTEAEARYAAPEDPLARHMQVAWTSARATHCGFVFNPDQLRSDFLAAEARSGIPPEQIPKIARAYDYTRKSVLDTIKDDPSYCNTARTAAIRLDLNRYLTGDYAPTARLAR